MPIGLAIAGAAGLGGNLLSGLLGKNAANKAASQQEQAVQQALQAQQQNLATTTKNVQPWIGAGTNALTSLQQLLGIGPGGSGATNPVLQMLGIGPGGAQATGGINPATFQGSPGYQWQLSQGEQAAEQAGARTGLGGNTLKALQTYGTGLANQDWYNYLNTLGNQYQQLIGNVGGLSNTGVSTGLNLGQIGAGTANAISDLFTQGGNAAAGGTVGGTNALTGGITGALNNLITQSSSPGGGLFGALQQLISNNANPNQFTFPGGSTVGGSAGASTLNSMWNPFNPVGTQSLYTGG